MRLDIAVQDSTLGHLSVSTGGISFRRRGEGEAAWRARCAKVGQVRVFIAGGCSAERRWLTSPRFECLSTDLGLWAVWARAPAKPPYSCSPLARPQRFADVGMSGNASETRCRGGLAKSAPQNWPARTYTIAGGGLMVSKYLIDAPVTPRQAVEGRPVSAIRHVLQSQFPASSFLEQLRRDR